MLLGTFQKGRYKKKRPGIDKQFKSKIELAGKLAPFNYRANDRNIKFGRYVWRVRTQIVRNPMAAGSVDMARATASMNRYKAEKEFLQKLNSYQDNILVAA